MNLRVITRKKWTNFVRHTVRSFNFNQFFKNSDLDSPAEESDAFFNMNTYFNFFP